VSGLRIALSGSAGTGKSTLGTRLAEELDLPYLAEEMRTRLERGLDVHRLDGDGWRRLVAELWEEQREREAGAPGGFVCDRSSLDYAAFWLHYGLFDAVTETERWMERMAAEAGRYDGILLFPWGALPLEDDGVRSTNRWTQLRFQTILEGLHDRYAPAGRVLRVPATDDFEARLAFALSSLRRRP